MRVAGAHCVRIPLHPPAFRYDWDRVQAAFTGAHPPHRHQQPVQSQLLDLNRRGSRRARRMRAQPVPSRCFSDEVYEHVLYDGRRHVSVLTHAELRERSFAVFSFGKTLHATGWRTGYCVAPPDMTRELRKVHQFNTFSIAAPLQHAIARYLGAHPEVWQNLAAFFQPKRDLLAGLLHGTGFEPVPAQGTYFQLVDYGALSDAGDLDFADRLIREAGVATIPLSPFYASTAAHDAHPAVRCEARRDAPLGGGAAARLCGGAHGIAVACVAARQGSRHGLLDGWTVGSLAARQPSIPSGYQYTWR